MKILYNCTIVNEGREFRGYVAIKDDRIARVGVGECPEYLLQEARETENLKGAFLMPGVIDTHVHYRDPGLTHKGDIESESRAGVSGGVTSFIDMPNTKPATVTIEAFEDKMRHAAETSWENYGFYIGATDDNLEELKKGDYSRIAGVKLFMGASTGKMAVGNQETLEGIFRDVDALIAVHAEDDAIIGENMAKITDFSDVSLHPQIRSREACISASGKAVELAKKYGSRLHILHISTEDEVNLLEASENLREKRITAETCPHYLVLSDHRYADKGAFMKCNPAIKSAEDAEEIGNALTDGRIDVIGSDHAPHLREEKEVAEPLKAPSGMPGNQTELPMMCDLTIASPIGLNMARIAELMSHNPAILFGIEDRGFIREGCYADLVVVRREEEDHVIDDSEMNYKCGWTPYSGMTTRHRVEATYVNGFKAFPYGEERPPVMALRFSKE